MSVEIPKYIQKYFWGDDLKDLSWEKHQKYITKTLLERGNINALKWLFNNTSQSEVKKDVGALNLTSRSKHFWQIYLA